MDNITTDTGNAMHDYQQIIFKPGAHGQRQCAPGFLKLLWFARQYVCVCPPLRAFITSGVIWRDTMCNWLNKFYGFPCFNYFI